MRKEAACGREEERFQIFKTCESESGTKEAKCSKKEKRESVGGKVIFQGKCS